MTIFNIFLWTYYLGWFAANFFFIGRNCLWANLALALRRIVNQTRGLFYRKCRFYSPFSVVAMWYCVLGFAQIWQFATLALIGSPGGGYFKLQLFLELVGWECKLSGYRPIRLQMRWPDWDVDIYVEHIIGLVFGASALIIDYLIRAVKFINLILNDNYSIE